MFPQTVTKIHNILNNKNCNYLQQLNNDIRNIRLDVDQSEVLVQGDDR